MIRELLLPILFLASFSLSSQSFDWIQTGDSLMGDDYSFLVADKHSNLYALQTGNSAGQSGLWGHLGILNRIRPDGSRFWRKSIQLGYFGWVNNLKVDAAGSVYLGLNNSSALEGDTASYEHMVLYKLDSLGNKKWKAKMKTNMWNGGRTSTNADGNTLLSAGFYMENGHYPDSISVVNSDTIPLTKTGILLAMINSSGVETWHKYVETDGYPVHHTAINKGHILLSGDFKDKVTIDTSDFANSNGDDHFIALFKADGTFIKFRSFKGNYYRYNTGYYPNNNIRVYCDTSGNFYLTDVLNSYFSYGDSLVQEDTAINDWTHQKSILLKLDTGLNPVWIKKISSETIFNVNADNGTGLLLNTLGHLVYKVSRTSGELIFCGRDNSSNMCAVELPDGKFVLGGSFRNGSVFGDMDHWNGYYGNWNDYYLASFSSSLSPHLTAVFSVPDTVCEGQQIRVNNQSLNATQFLWKWSPGQSSDLATPAITFSTQGTNTITLVASNGSSVDSISRAIYVKPLPDMVITAPSFICAPDSIISFQKTGIADSILWNYGGYANMTWYETNYYDWADTLHWGKEFLSSYLQYTFNIYKKGCSKLGYVNVNNPVPGYGTIFIYEGTKIRSGIVEPNVHLQWYYNDSLLPGDTSSILIPNATGYYKCRFGDSCYYFSRSLYFVTTGFENASAGEHSVWLIPNPASTQIQLRGTDIINEVEIFDLQGRSVLFARPQTVNPEIPLLLASGLYLVKVSSGGKYHLQKLLVE